MRLSKAIGDYTIAEIGEGLSHHIHAAITHQLCQTCVFLYDAELTTIASAGATRFAPGCFRITARMRGGPFTLHAVEKRGVQSVRFSDRRACSYKLIAGIYIALPSRFDRRAIIPLTAHELGAVEGEEPQDFGCDERAQGICSATYHICP